MRAKDTIKIVVQFVFLVAGCLVLQACVTAAITGAQMAYDHTSIQKQISDYCILANAKSTVYNDPELKGAHINISVFKGLVLITGQVPTSAMRGWVVEDVQDIRGVLHIYNFLTVAKPSDMATRSHDTWITTKIKSKIVASNSLVPDKIKVVTENGVVYLMAVLTHAEADKVVDIAAHTDGVSQVVKIFYYIIMPTLS